MSNDPKSNILVEGGDVFDGTRDQFSNCFFSNADDEQVIDWCRENKFTLLIDGKTLVGKAREVYEQELKGRQEAHLNSVYKRKRSPQWTPCMHDQCTSCHGTGIKEGGYPCVHNISCFCPKCSPSY